MHYLGYALRLNLNLNSKFFFFGKTISNLFSCMTFELARHTRPPCSKSLKYPNNVLHSQAWSRKLALPLYNPEMPSCTTVVRTQSTTPPKRPPTPSACRRTLIVSKGCPASTKLTPLAYPYTISTRAHENLIRWLTIIPYVFSNTSGAVRHKIIPP